MRSAAPRKLHAYAWRLCYVWETLAYEDRFPHRSDNQPQAGHGGPNRKMQRLSGDFFWLRSDYRIREANRCDRENTRELRRPGNYLAGSEIRVEAVNHLG